MSTPTSSERTPSPENNFSNSTLQEASAQRNATTSETVVVNTSVAGAGVVATPVPGLGVPAAAPFGGRLRDLWRFATSNWKVSFGMGIAAFFVLLAIFGPIILPQDPNTFSHDTLAPPSAAHWFGTTQTGQDVFTQVIVGTRVSVFVGVVAGLLSTIISITIGLTAGYIGGIVDDVLSVIINIFLVLPGLPLAIVLAAYSPVKGPLPIAFVLTITSWSWGARVLRAQTLSLRERDFVNSARVSGESNIRIIFAEILPNVIAIVAAGMIGTIVYVILAEAGLEYLGLGDTTVVSWGTMFYWAGNAEALMVGAWWWFLPPGFCIALLGAGLTFINFGIDEIANPRLRTEPRPKAQRLTKARRILQPWG